MTDAQTEARAIAQASLWIPAKQETERIARAVYDSTGYDAPMEVVEFVMAEADRRHRTALTTERAAHAETKRERDEARKALEPFAWIGQWLFARDLPDETPVVMVEGAGKPFALTRGMFKAAHTAARRALEAQGGEDVL